MTVKELINELQDFNPDAPIYFGPTGEYKSIDIFFGGAEGCIEKNCDYVHMTYEGNWYEDSSN